MRQDKCNKNNFNKTEQLIRKGLPKNHKRPIFAFKYSNLPSLYHMSRIAKPIKRLMSPYLKGKAEVIIFIPAFLSK